MKRETKHLATETHPPRGSHERKRSFHKLGNPLTNGVSGELWNFRWQHNEQQQKITTEFLLNYLRKSGSHALVCLQQVGAGCGEAGGIIGPYRGWMPWGHSEGANVTKQLKPWEWQRDKEKQRPFPLEGSKAALWPLVHSQTKDCALVNTKGEQAGNCLRHSPGGKRGMCTMPRVGTQGAIAISVPETAAPIKLWTGCQSLTTSSWSLKGSYLPGVSRPRLASWGDSRSTWDCTLRAHRGAWVAWTWEIRRHVTHLGLSPHEVPRRLSSLDLGSVTTLGPGNPRVAHPLGALPTHASGVCSPCPSPSTAQLRKQAWIRGQAPFAPSCQGRG